MCMRGERDGVHERREGQCDGVHERREGQCA